MSDSTEEFSDNGIAVIGLSGRFPSAKNVEEFWQILLEKKDAITKLEETELEYTNKTPESTQSGMTFVRARGVLEDADQFDAAFFGMYPKEAEVLDPQHRVFLECAWEALEGGGYESETYEGLIGIYAGCSINSYLIYNLCKDRKFAEDFTGTFQVGNYHTMIGNDKDFMPTRVSFKLNLKGPSMTVQTACSTSLVAVCQACLSLQNYQCDMALAGGVSISFPQKRDYVYQEGAMVSKDGTVRAFDAEAKGTVFGHGAGVVLLKRAEDAIKDGDDVLAIVKGYALNNDGSDKIGYAAPSVDAQAEVIQMAQASAGIHPESISYIEAHGTGTPLGDPIEIAALEKAFRNNGATKKQYCAIGTGKTNIGHLDAAAGVTGLIKTVLQLKKEKIPALLHFNSPNPKIDFDNSPFYPAKELMDWKRGNQPRRAGVSAFGVGGTNAHVILEEAPSPIPTSQSRCYQILPLSAKTETALGTMVGNLANFLKANPETNLADASHTLVVGRRRFDYRSSVCARDTTDAIEKLRALSAKSVKKLGDGFQDPRIVFLFPGQGSQYVNMGKELYENESVFREAVDECSIILNEHLGMDIRKTLYPSHENLAKAEKEINETQNTQPAIFVIEYATAQLWLSWGIEPSALIGHSIGEYVAAVMCETFSLADVLELVSHRAQLMADLPGGSMLAVRKGVQDLAEYINEEVAIAAINSPNISTLSGPTETIVALQEKLSKKNIMAKIIPTSHAFHSCMMEPIVDEFTRIAATKTPQEPRKTWYSTCTGKQMDIDTLSDPSYWSRQLRHTVLFAEALENVLEEPGAILLEVGSGRALSQISKQHPKVTKDMPVFSSLGEAEKLGSETAAMLQTLGKLWEYNCEADWLAFRDREPRRRIKLPTYPFERKRFWTEPAPKAETIDTAESNKTRPVMKEINIKSAEDLITEQLRIMDAQIDILRKAKS